MIISQHNAYFHLISFQIPLLWRRPGPGWSARRIPLGGHWSRLHFPPLGRRFRLRGNLLHHCSIHFQNQKIKTNSNCRGRQILGFASFSLSLSYEYSSKRRLHVIYSFVKDYLECERPHIEIYAHISLFSHAPSLSPLPRSAVTMTPQDTCRIECHTNDFGLLR